MNEVPSFKKGLAWGLLAFLTWGIVPIYWKLLHGISFVEVLGHRILWSAVILGSVLLFQKDIRGFSGIVTQKKNILFLIPTTLLILFNWNLFIWGVDNNYIVECSMGYFINPLLNVFLGVFLLKEKLKPVQWISIAFAFIGILIMLLSRVGRPEISIGLALSFALYGLLKKKMNVKPMHSLFFETISLVFPVLIYFGYLINTHEFSFFNEGPIARLLMIGGGVVTVVPLLAFGHAVRHLSLTTVGIMQYMTPTMQLMSGVFLYGEAFTSDHAWSFGFIWCGLLIYTLHGLMEHRKKSWEKNETSLSTGV